MDLFFEIQRKKTHIYCDVKETCNVSELKKIIEGILKIPVAKQVLKKAMDEHGKSWENLDDRKTLADSGFTSSNARAQSPAVIALIIPTEDHDVTIEPLSTPPPLPDAMRQDNTATETTS